MIVFRVRGLPVAQGSPRIGRRGRSRGLREARPTIRKDSDALMAWRELVALVARRHRPPEPIDRPAVVHAVFTFPEPKRLRERVYVGGLLVKATKPDLDKLQRALGDSLVDAGILTDDSRIIGWPAMPGKVYGPEPGVDVAVCAL